MKLAFFRSKLYSLVEISFSINIGNSSSARFTQSLIAGNSESGNLVFSEIYFSYFEKIVKLDRKHKLKREIVTNHIG